MKTQLIPYLNFDGDARQAMEFYKSIFGGELSIQTFGDAFPETPSEMKERIMHVQLKNDDITIMASDTHPEHSSPLAIGNNVYLSLIGSDSEKLTEYFNKLSEGGQVEMPLEKQFWGDVFGSLKDKFGVGWMINISSSN